MDIYNNCKNNKAPNKKLLEFCQRYCFVNQILEPTRVTASSKTLIDVILSNQQDRYALRGNLHLDLSDHDLIFTIRKNKLLREKNRLIEYRSMKNFNEARWSCQILNMEILHIAYCSKENLSPFVKENLSSRTLHEQIKLVKENLQGKNLFIVHTSK